MHIEDKQEEWHDIENLIVEYKRQYKKEASIDDIEASKHAANELLNKFSPLLKKYTMLLKTGQIDFKDKDVKYFVKTFIDDPRLHRALKRQKSKIEYRADIYRKFGFVLETYGQLTEEEIYMDMQMLLLILAKRYKQMGKNFCAYIHNCFRYEVSRFIKAYIKNPLNISYKNISYNDVENGEYDKNIELIHEDLYYEPANGIPDMSWISGQTCGDIFLLLNPLERKILIKYYIEDYNDKQIANMLGFHINTVNQKRRLATTKLADFLGINLKDIKRNRHSGKRYKM